jgi:hypothetical protein
MARHSRQFSICKRSAQPSLSFLTNLLLFQQTGAIDDVYKTITTIEDAEKQAEGKKIVEQLGSLKYEMLHDRQLTYGFLSSILS